MPAAGDAATWQLDSAWRWPPWATLLLVLVAILWTVMLYARESSSAGRPLSCPVGRLAADGHRACVLIMLAQWALALRLTGPPAIALVIDRSASMGIADRYDDPALTAQLAERLSTDRPHRTDAAQPGQAARHRERRPAALAN